MHLFELKKSENIKITLEWIGISNYTETMQRFPNVRTCVLLVKSLFIQISF